MKINYSKKNESVYRIAVILPELYRGGTLRGAINIARMLKLGADSAGCSLDLSFGHVDSSLIYSDSDFEDLLDIGIKIRPFKRETVSGDDLKPIYSRMGFEKPSIQNDVYWNFNDGISNFEDCDFWIIVSDRIHYPIPVNRPYAVVVYDYIQRYVPEIFGTNAASVGNWKMFDAFAEATRRAQFVICTTDQTKRDCINYAGVSAERVHKFPLEFDPLKSGNHIVKDRVSKAPYLLWTTNSTQHKNHLNVINGLEKYYRQNPNSKIEIHVTGVYTHLFSKKGSQDPHFMDEYAVRVRKAIDDRPNLKKRLHILGNLSDEVYLDKLHNAYGVLHGALYDNGTYSIVEAAWLGVPSISSDYPAIREACDIFSLKPILFNPREPAELCEAIQNFDEQHETLRDQLPDRNKLQCRTFNVVAQEYWSKFVNVLESTKHNLYE